MGPQHSNSECSFSGLNDFDPEEGPSTDQVQNYGWAIKFMPAPRNIPAEAGRAIPGFACNGHLSPLQDADAPE